MPTLGWPVVAPGTVGVGANLGLPRPIVLGDELENAFRRQIRPGPGAWV